MKAGLSLRKYLASIMLVIVFNPVALADEYNDAIDAFNSNNYEAAQRIWTDLANQGDVISQFNLGIMYEQGLGFDSNISQAIDFYTLAATENFSPAQLNLGNIYYAWSKETPSYVRDAIFWWTKAAQNGEVGAQIQLGSISIYVQGGQVAYDVEAATYWLEQAKNKGYKPADDLLLELESYTNLLTPRNSWVKEQNPNAFTIALSTAPTFTSALTIAKQAGLTNFAVFESARGNQHVISGVFLKEAEAKLAITRLPDHLKSYHPFVQQFEVIF